MLAIDLNCDFGESFGVYQTSEDDRMLDYVSSVNIACGFHAGDPASMQKVVRLAKEKSVAIGAHPGLPDLIGFGRRNMEITANEAYQLTVYQIGAIAAFCKANNTTLQHVKPHGALYNMAAKDRRLADAIASAIHDVNPALILFGLSGSALVAAGKEIGLRTASEVFADRTYQADGSLTPRRQANAMVTDDEVAVQQVLQMVQRGTVHTVDGQEVGIQADTVCLHGDGAHALAFAKRIRQAMAEADIGVRSFG